MIIDVNVYNVYNDVNIVLHHFLYTFVLCYVPIVIDVQCFNEVV